MDVSARTATVDDLYSIAQLYDGLETEMTGLKAVWRLTEGLPGPIDEALSHTLEDPDSVLLIGIAFGVPAGFLLGRIENLLPQAEGARHGSIRFIYTGPGFREIGVGEAMMNLFVEWARTRGVAGLDAHVSPGHRMAKNFFESNGLKARHIVMHREGG